MRVFVVMAHYDPDGEVAPHVRRHVLALSRLAERVVVVSTADLKPAHEKWLADHSVLLRRENYGYDFFSYRAGLLATDLTDYDRVVICNDSFVGPFVDYETIFTSMSGRPVDFWGMTRTDRVEPHVQSFFVCFMPWVVRSQAFTEFWQRMTPLSDRRQVILRHEVGLSRVLSGAGFASGSYYVESEADAKLARRRVWWWAVLRTQSTGLRERWPLIQARGREAWNPCAGLADKALDGSLPLVKIDTLRYDPYGLDADRLLIECERVRPDLFADVRAFLERTAAYYPARPNEQLPLPALPVRPFKYLVRYA